MTVTVCWDDTIAQPPAREAALASMLAVDTHDKQAWLTLFATDAVVEDPVGPSGFDPDGTGHRGHDGISAFWDLSIAAVERFEFTVHDSHAAGDEVANVGTITTYLPGNYRVDTDLVAVYRVNDEGKLVAVRAFWETERAFATARQVGE
jgi:steroid Delta-isomerase